MKRSKQYHRSIRSGGTKTINAGRKAFHMKDFIMSEEVIQDFCRLLNIKNKAIQRIDIGLELGHPVVVNMEYRPRKPKHKKRLPMGFAATENNDKNKKKKKSGDES